MANFTWEGDFALAVNWLPFAEEMVRNLNSLSSAPMQMNHQPTSNVFIMVSTKPDRVFIRASAGDYEFATPTSVISLPAGEFSGPRFWAGKPAGKYKLHGQEFDKLYVLDVDRPAPPPVIWHGVDCWITAGYATRYAQRKAAGFTEANWPSVLIDAHAKVFNQVEPLRGCVPFYTSPLPVIAAAKHSYAPPPPNKNQPPPAPMPTLNAITSDGVAYMWKIGSGTAELASLSVEIAVPADNGADLIPSGYWAFNASGDRAATVMWVNQANAIYGGTYIEHAIGPHTTTYVVEVVFTQQIDEHQNEDGETEYSRRFVISIDRVWATPDPCVAADYLVGSGELVTAQISRCDFAVLKGQFSNSRFQKYADLGTWAYTARGAGKRQVVTGTAFYNEKEVSAQNAVFTGMAYDDITGDVTAHQVGMGLAMGEDMYLVLRTPDREVEFAPGLPYLTLSYNRMGPNPGSFLVSGTSFGEIAPGKIDLRTEECPDLVPPFTAIVWENSNPPKLISSIQVGYGFAAHKTGAYHSHLITGADMRIKAATLQATNLEARQNHEYVSAAVFYEYITDAGPNMKFASCLPGNTYRLDEGLRRFRMVYIPQTIACVPHKNGILRDIAIYNPPYLEEHSEYTLDFMVNGLGVANPGYHRAVFGGGGYRDRAFVAGGWAKTSV